MNTIDQDQNNSRFIFFFLINFSLSSQCYNSKYGSAMKIDLKHCPVCWISACT